MVRDTNNLLSSVTSYRQLRFGDQWAPLRDAYDLPPCRSCIRDRVAITIGLGGLHSGAPWHFHDAAFVEVLHGLERH
eukprot:5804657-Amphidinium_carterae.1